MTLTQNQTGAPMAVIDLGKTNTKILVISGAGEILTQYRTAPNWSIRGGVSVLDDQASSLWIMENLAKAVQDHGVDAVMISGHGCTFALLKGEALALPILDYEQDIPEDLNAYISAQIPDFSETCSPPLPLGLNISRHMMWMEQCHAEVFAAADTLLTYPQFWSWKLSGVKCAEVSYLGCHTDIWAPLEDDYSSLVEARGWRGKMPSLVRAGAVIGQHEVGLDDGSTKQIAVHNGVHDSNAALYYYRAFGDKDFTLISTGTWVVIFNPSCPIEALKPHWDMLANVTVDHELVATIRFMGGREYDVISEGYQDQIRPDLLERVIEKQIFALPSFAAGGPVPELSGRLLGPKPDPHERAAVAVLYVALMTDLSLDLIRSKNPLVIDGGMVKSKVYAGLIAQLRPKQTVATSPVAEGTAFGAAALAFEATERTPFTNRNQYAVALNIKGLKDYRAQWRSLINQARTAGEHI